MIAFISAVIVALAFWRAASHFSGSGKPGCFDQFGNATAYGRNLAESASSDLESVIRELESARRELSDAIASFPRTEDPAEGQETLRRLRDIDRRLSEIIGEDAPP